MTAARLSRIRMAAARNTVRWQKTRQLADAAMQASRPASIAIPPLSLAYLATSNSAYARKAIQVMLQLATPANNLRGDSYYDYRFTLPDMVAGFDWCHDMMSPNERKAIAGWLMDRADDVWPETNPSRAQGWGVHSASNNYFSGFLMTWPAALAVYGDDPRARKHLDLALTKYKTLLRPFLAGWGRGGFCAESANYDSTFRYGLILDAHLTATGEDLVNDPGAPYMHDSLLWRIHSTVPTKDLYYNIGDQPRESLGPLSDYDRQRAFVPMSSVSDAALVRYAKYWLDTITPSSSRWDQTAAWEFLFYDDNAFGQNYGAALPLWYFAQGPGILLRRSGWDRDATYWGIWSGPLRESHQSRDVNGFLIFKGGWLAGNANMWSQSGIVNDTAGQNNITIGGMGQTWQETNSRWPEEAGRVLKQENTEEYSYFAGRNAQAYVQERARGGTPLLRDSIRKIVYLAPDAFIVYDRVQPVNPRTTIEWRLHSKSAITVHNSQYSFDNGKYALQGQLLAPANGATIKSVPVNQGVRGARSSERLDIVVNAGVAPTRLVNVLQVSRIGAPVSAVHEIKPVSGNVFGVEMAGWVVWMGNSEKVVPPVSYNIDTARQTEHLAMDLAPNTSFRIILTDRRTRASNSFTKNSTNQGSLRFDVPAGQYFVAIEGAAGRSSPTQKR